MNLPLVTCLCLTMKGREDWLMDALHSFGDQDYPQKELLIIADDFEDVRRVSHLLGLGSDRGYKAASSPRVVCGSERGETTYSIVVSNLIANKPMNVGEKRNFGCGWALGDLIAIWDDDDHSSPGRLSQQVAELQATSKAVTGYREMKFTDGASWWQFRYPRGLVLGTSLMFTKEYWRKHPFLEVNIGGDEGFAADAAAANQLAEVPDLDLMYATIHAGNTSKRKMTDRGWVSLPGFQWRDKS